jgi:hypothetical protein
VGSAPSSCRPPWFDTITAETPCSTASRASSHVRTPLSRTGTPALSRSRSDVGPPEARIELLADEPVEPGRGPHLREMRLEIAAEVGHLEPVGQPEPVVRVALAVALHGHAHGEADGAASGLQAAAHQLVRERAVAKT